MLLYMLGRKSRGLQVAAGRALEAMVAPSRLSTHGTVPSLNRGGLGIRSPLDTVWEP